MEDFFTSIPTEVYVAIIGLVSTVATALVGRYQNRRSKHELLLAEQEMKLQIKALDLHEFITEWDSVGAELRSLLKETEIDRFMMLRAWNGYLEPRWTTAFYQMRTGEQDPVQYVHYELDKDYIDRLRRITGGLGRLYFTTDSLPQSGIKDIYKAEKVTAAYWHHLASKRLAGSRDSRAITYCSFATHEGEISAETRVRCDILAGRLKGLTLLFLEEDEDFR